MGGAFICLTCPIPHRCCTVLTQRYCCCCPPVQVDLPVFQSNAAERMCSFLHSSHDTTMLPLSLALPAQVDLPVFYGNKMRRKMKAGAG